MTDHDHELDDFRHRVDRIHAATPGSEGAPPDLWHRVRAQIETTGEETTAMSSISTPVDLTRGSYPNTPAGQHRFVRYANLAATIALVFAVAVGGWLAALRLNDPSPEPRFAALGVQSDETGDGVCDVDSLTVEDAILIVQNPVTYLYGGEANAREDGWDTILDEGDSFNFVGAPIRDWSLITGLTPHAAMPVSEEEFSATSAVVEEYWDCVQSGTKGQVWALFDPVVVQYEIATRIPLLLPLDETRIVIEQMLGEPSFSSPVAEVNDRTWRVNPNADMAVRVDSGLTFHANRSIILPIQFLDRDENIVGSFDIYGVPDPNLRASTDHATNIVLTYSRVTDTWYLAGSFEASRYYEVEELD